MNDKNHKEHTLSVTTADHAEAWWKEEGNKVPKRNTKEWDEMYVAWHTYAFASFK